MERAASSLANRPGPSVHAPTEFSGPGLSSEDCVSLPAQAGSPSAGGDSWSRTRCRGPHIRREVDSHVPCSLRPKTSIGSRKISLGVKIPTFAEALEAWRLCPIISEEEKVERADIAQRIEQTLCVNAPFCDLKIQDAQHITELPPLPKKLRHLTIKNLPALKRLPTTAHLDGSLLLERLPQVEAFSGTWNISGSFSVANCDAMHTCIYSGRLVNLRLENLPQLKQLGTWLTLERDLEIKACPAITLLPKRLWIGGDFTLMGATQLACLDACGSIKGNLVISGLSGLETVVLSETLDVQRKITFEKCLDLKRLDWSTTTLRASLHIRACPDFEALKEDADVDGHVILQELPKFTHFGRRLVVGEDLVVDNLPHLLELSQHLSIRGSLLIDKCPELCGVTSLEGEVENLVISGSAALSHLPPEVRVRGTLDLTDASSLDNLPLLLWVDGDLILCGCRSLCCLPKIASTEASAYPQHFWLEGSGLVSTPEKALEASSRLAICHSAGSAHDFFALPLLHPSRFDFDPLLTAIHQLHAVVAEHHPSLGSQGIRLLGEGTFLLQEEIKTLSSFIILLCEPFCLLAVGGQGDAVQKGLPERILRFLDELWRHPSMASHLISEMLAVLDRDHLARMLTFGELELSLRVQNAMRVDCEETELQNLGTGIFALELLRRHIATRFFHETHFRGIYEFSEQVDVFASFFSRLREPLNLPIASLHTASLSGFSVSSSHVLSALHQVRLAQADLQRRLDFFASWEPWQIFLRKRKNAQNPWGQLRSLTISSVMAHQNVCSFELLPASELQEPVCFVSTGGRQVFEYASLCRWWAENGTHPIERTALETLGDVRRLLWRVPKGTMDP